MAGRAANLTCVSGNVAVRMTERLDVTGRPVALRELDLGTFFRPRSVVVTLHDLIWIDHPHEYQFGVNWFAAEWFRQISSAGIRYTLRSADHVI